MAKFVKLLLTENVDNLGIVGDVVEVRPGHARNFLLPRNMATQPTAGNIKRLAARRAQVELEMKERRARLEVTLQKLQGFELTLQRSANEQGVLFGGVSQHDIGEALRAEGYGVDDRAVRLGHQIKRLDTYTIPIVLASDLKTEIKLWVVSDKPAEQLEAEAAAGGEGEQSGDDDERRERVERGERAGQGDEARGDGDRPARRGRRARDEGGTVAADEKAGQRERKPKGKGETGDKDEKVGKGE